MINVTKKEYILAMKVIKVGVLKYCAQNIVSLGNAYPLKF